MEIFMQLNKIKLALGLVAGFAVAAPMVASAAADQDKAIGIQYLICPLVSFI